MTELVRNKIPLAQAAENFAAICASIDEGNLDETILALFDATRHDLVTSVNRRICFLDFLRSAVKNAEENKDAWKQRCEQLKIVKERVDGLTIEAMKVLGVREVAGDIGKLRMQNNPEALHLEFETYKPHVNNVIDPEQIQRFDIADKYIKKFAAFQIDTAQVKADLQAGAALPWASLTRGLQLRTGK